MSARVDRTFRTQNVTRTCVTYFSGKLKLDSNATCIVQLRRVWQRSEIRLSKSFEYANTYLRSPYVQFLDHVRPFRIYPCDENTSGCLEGLDVHLHVRTIPRLRNTHTIFECAFGARTMLKHIERHSREPGSRECGVQFNELCTECAFRVFSYAAAKACGMHFRSENHTRLS